MESDTNTSKIKFSNGHSSLIDQTTTGQLNGYETTLNKLVFILKSKTSDKLKQLEDLWDSLNKTNNSDTTTNQQILNDSKQKQSINTNKLRTSPTPGSNSQSPIHVSDNSNDSTSSISINLKRDSSKSSFLTPLLEHQAKKQKIMQQNVTKSTIELKKSSKLIQETKSKPIVAKTINNNIKNVNSKKKDDSDSRTSSLNESNSNSNDAAVNEQFLQDMEVEILNLTCSLCKQFNQEINNKLVECRNCSKLYHQLCHMPKIDNKEIESDNEIKNSNESDNKQMDWYLSKCSLCKSNETKTTFDNLGKQSNSFLSLNEKNQNEEQQKQNGAPSIKGLAALATKFGSNGRINLTDNNNNNNKKPNQIESDLKRVSSANEISNAIFVNENLSNSTKTNTKNNFINKNNNNAQSNGDITFKTILDKKPNLSNTINKMSNQTTKTNFERSKIS